MGAFAQELETAAVAVTRAGALVRENYARLEERDISEKAVNDLVTTVDVRSQEIVVAALRERFPDDYIIAEEALPDAVNAGRDPQGRRRWYIDPLDGTTNYIHAYPVFGVSVALEVDGRMSVGATQAPLSGELFCAARGHGATLDGRPMRVSAVTARNRMLLGTGFPFRARQYLDIYLQSFSYFFNSARGVRRAGAATLDFANVAAGRLDGFWEMTLSPWDMAAGVVLIEEAGGRVSDFFGGDSYLRSGHIVGTNGLLHEWMTGELSKIFSPDQDYSLRS
jgi:myo-inositol-1(or 4)-monophosphatase